MKVAYQGEPGAYSERAVRSLFADAEPLPCDTVRHAFSRVTSGEASFGVVPLENSQAGSVNETYELLANTSLLRIVGESIVAIDHALLGVPGARLEDVRRAHSHWQALAQCEDFLSAMRIEPVPEHDTAGAARKIAEAADPAEGAIASVDAAGLSGLIVLAERIQTEKENFTKFAVIGSADPGFGAADKTSMVMAVLDEPGSLLGALAPFRCPWDQPAQTGIAPAARGGLRVPDVRGLHGGGRRSRGRGRAEGGPGAHLDAEDPGLLPLRGRTGLTA